MRIDWHSCELSRSVEGLLYLKCKLLQLIRYASNFFISTKYFGTASFASSFASYSNAT
jgi:hypothetical protein